MTDKVIQAIQAELAMVLQSILSLNARLSQTMDEVAALQRKQTQVSELQSAKSVRDCACCMAED